LSDFRAIGGVSVTLKALLEDRMELPTGLPGLPASLSTPVVTISTPPSEENGVDTTKSWINLFLYRVTENGHLKNQEIPGQGFPGAYGHPPLSLDLHYVLTAYGATNGQNELPGDERVAHYLLGSAMRVLHDHPVITKQLRTVKSPAGEQILDQSLTEEFEQVKLYLDPISLEDLSKVWTSLMLSYRLSVAYKVTVVQIESQRLRRFPKPVGEPTSAGPRVYAVPFQSPQIQELRVRRGNPSGAESPFPYARVGDILVIRGRNFGNKPVKVLLGGLEVPVTPQSDDRIELVMPDTEIVLDENPPDGPEIPEERRLQPGAQPVSVVLSVPELPQTGFRSNQAVFMLVPLIASPDPPNQNLPSLEPNLNAVPRTLKVRGKRLFLGTLSGETLVGPALIGKNSYRNPSPTEITVSLPDTLPARLVQTLISEGLSFPTNLPNQLEIRVKFGTEAPRTTTLTKKPTTLEDAADILQAAIRSTPGGGIAFKGARVTTVGDRLVVVPGGLFFDPVTISGTRMADQLKLSTGRQVKGAYLSGELVPFPVLTAAQPSLGVTIGGPLRTVTLTSRPTTLADAADILQAAIQTAGTTLGRAAPDKDAFSGARVTVLGGQLLILPGSSGQVNFGGVPDGDQTSVAELQLRTRYPVRVRVNGAESIDDKGVEIPERVP
jgi:hypothetical protein